MIDPPQVLLHGAKRVEVLAGQTVFIAKGRDQNWETHGQDAQKLETFPKFAWKYTKNTIFWIMFDQPFNLLKLHEADLEKDSSLLVTPEILVLTIK